MDNQPLSLFLLTFYPYSAGFPLSKKKRKIFRHYFQLLITSIITVWIEKSVYAPIRQLFVITVMHQIIVTSIAIIKQSVFKEVNQGQRIPLLKHQYVNVNCFRQYIVSVYVAWIISNLFQVSALNTIIKLDFHKGITNYMD